MFTPRASMHFSVRRSEGARHRPGSRDTHGLKPSRSNRTDSAIIDLHASGAPRVRRSSAVAAGTSATESPFFHWGGPSRRAQDFSGVRHLVAMGARPHSRLSQVDQKGGVV